MGPANPPKTPLTANRPSTFFPEHFCVACKNPLKAEAKYTCSWPCQHWATCTNTECLMAYYGTDYGGVDEGATLCGKKYCQVNNCGKKIQRWTVMKNVSINTTWLRRLKTFLVLYRLLLTLFFGCRIVVGRFGPVFQLEAIVRILRVV